MKTDQKTETIDYGYSMRAAAPDAWRNYDREHPEPGYFEFDWLSARHPDLYHKFALSSVGLMHELAHLVDLADLVVVDIGAGTGRATVPAAQRAKHVVAVDAYASVVGYGARVIAEAGLSNVSYLIGDSAKLPLQDRSVDAAICAWAVLHYSEAHRVLRPGGHMIQLIGAPGSLCGELTATLAGVYPELITEVAPPDVYAPDCPPTDSVVEGEHWNGVPVEEGVNVHEFTYVADYGTVDEAAAIYGRLYGPQATTYLLDRKQSTVAYRLRICYGITAQ